MSKRQGASRSKVQHRLEQATGLIQRKRWQEAVDLLDPILRQHPSDIDVLGLLAVAYDRLGRPGQAWRAAHKLVKLDPHSPEVWYNATVTCMANEMPFSARDYAQHYLTTWPERPEAKDVRAMLKTLEKVCQDLAQENAHNPSFLIETAPLYEAATASLELGELAEVRRLSQHILQMNPRAIAPHNNLSLVAALEGSLSQATEIARGVLAQHPDNIHARSNLVQYLEKTGQHDEALVSAQPLHTLVSDHEEDFAKQVEALSFLGDDAGVMALYEAFEQQRKLANAVAKHLAAVAYARTGHEQRAQALWGQVKADLDVAQANLDDLKLSVGERNGAWPFSLNQWLPQAWLERLKRVLEKGQHSDTVLRRELDKLFKALPALSTLIPIWLQRGDPDSRELALMLAKTAQLPLLKDFALSPYGTDHQRAQAARAAIDLGLLPRDEPVPMYIKGKPTPILMFDFEITDEPTPHPMPDQAKDLLEDSNSLLHAGRFKEAEQTIQAGLAIVPNDPTFLNYLAKVLELTGRQAQADEVIRHTVALHPDYFFGQCDLALLHIREGRLEEAQVLLDPLLKRKHFHTSEFQVLCMAQAALLTAKKDFDGAKLWLKMWQNMEPDSPEPALYRRQLQAKGLR